MPYKMFLFKGKSLIINSLSQKTHNKFNILLVCKGVLQKNTFIQVAGWTGPAYKSLLLAEDIEFSHEIYN